MTVLKVFLGGLALGAALAAGPALAQPAGGPPPQAPTTRILAIGHVTPKFSLPALRATLPAEVRETAKLYLQGKIADWYSRNDKPGVVFILNTSDPKAAQEMLATLPFDQQGLMEFDLIPIGPLAPLGVLLGGN
jgi:hypothetical protein